MRSSDDTSLALRAVPLMRTVTRDKQSSGAMVRRVQKLWLDPLARPRCAIHTQVRIGRPTGPFIKTPHPIFAKAVIRSPAEGPYLGSDRRGHGAIAKEFAGHSDGRGRSTALLRYDNGLAWRLAKKPLVATTVIRWRGGETQSLNSLERPQLLLEDGAPAVLLFACDETKQRTHAFNLRLPIQMSIAE